MLAGVLLIVLTCALGRWQLSRAHERIDKQARIEALEAQLAASQIVREHMRQKIMLARYQKPL